MLAHSIAMTLDSVNNLTDAISSIVTLVGTSLAGRAPDKEHPLGHGRIEYLAQTIVAAIILYAGISSLVESVKKIIHPDTTNYSFLTFTVLIVAIIVKLILGTYTGRVGKAMNSGSLSASGKDAMFDAVISTSVLASAIINIVFGLNLEAYVGVAIAIIIIKSGIDTIREGMNEIIGIRISPEISQAVKKTICEDERVIGAYDLVLNNYGPELLVGSVHVEIDDRMTATEIDAMERDIAEKVYAKHHIIMTAVGIYAQNKRILTLSTSGQSSRILLKDTMVSFRFTAFSWILSGRKCASTSSSILQSKTAMRSMSIYTMMSRMNIRTTT